MKPAAAEPPWPRRNENDHAGPRVDRPTSAPGRAVRWRRVFPGREDQVGHVRRFVAELLADYPERHDVALCATELATNAIRHTASGRGVFAIELSWTGMTIRLAVADDGAPTGPVLRRHDPDALAEAGRGLGVVASLCERYGAEGDNHGRVVWAHFRSAVVPASQAHVPLSPLPATEADAALLARQYAGWHTWFGHWTGQWWALPRREHGFAALVTASSARALASRLDAIQHDR
jgi:serine/threonine-protein kinase RsbW